METLWFITDRSPDLEGIRRSLERLLPSSCSLRSVTLEEACRSDLPRALILPYRKSYGTRESFQALSRRITDRFSREDAQDLRAYVFPADLSGEEFLEILGRGEDSALALLGDVVQITAGTDLHELAGQIRLYLETWEQQARERKRTSLHRQADFYLGWGATVLTVFSLGYSLFLFGLMVFGKWLPVLPGPLALVRSWQVYILPFTVWLGWIMLFSVLAGVFQKGLSGAVNEYDRLVSYPPDVFLFLLLAMAAPGGLAAILEEPGPIWFLVFPGFILDLVLDILRRRRVVGSRFRRFRALDKSMSTGADKSALARMLRDSGRRPITNALRKAWTGGKRIRIFVSYTHSSPWACQRVDELFALCREAGIECFVDKEGIPRGSSWRRSIFMGLLVADYFIAFADETSVRKQWPAAELEMALGLRAISGAPEPIVFVPPDFSWEVSREYLPVFRDTMLCSSEPDFFVRVIWYSFDALKTLILRAIAGGEAKSPTALFGSPAAAPDKALLRESDRVYQEMNMARRTLTARLIRQGADNDPVVDKRFGIYRSFRPEDVQRLRRFLEYGDRALDQLPPQKAYRMMRETLELAVMMGEAYLGVEYCDKIIAALYGSLLSDYMLYLEIHRYEYAAAYLYEQMGDLDQARTYVNRCLRGISAIQALRIYFFSDFSLDGDITLFGHGVTVLPLNFKLLSSSGFPDLLPYAKALDERLERRGK